VIRSQDNKLNKFVINIKEKLRQFLDNKENIMSLSIEQLRSSFSTSDQNTNSRPNNYYPFWNMPEGSQAVIRFLPDANEDNPMGFLVEKLSHKLTVNGETKTTPCHKMYGEECPICKVSAAYYKDGDEDNGKKYWRKKQHIAQILVVEDPLPADIQTGEKHEGKIRYISLGFQLFNIIKDAFESGELDEVPYAFEGGCNFIIKKTKQGKHDSYTLSKFARKSSDLTDEEIALAKDQMVDLVTLLPQAPEMSKTEAILEAALTGGSFEVEREETTTTNFKSVSKKEDDDVPFDVEETSVTESTSSNDDDDEYNDEASKILEQIRARSSNNV
jgi:hypothetical protein